MAGIICHNNGRYNIYSTVADGFHYEKSLSIEELTQEIRDDFGKSGIEQLPDRLARAHTTGHSCISGEPLEEFLCANRAGEDEQNLTMQECIENFLS